MSRRRIATATILAGVALLALGVLPTATLAETDAITICLQPCHASGGGFAPDIETVYMGPAENAGHEIQFSPRVVADTSTAEVAQGSKMPCDECHVMHGASTSSPYMFSETRTGPISTTRELCVGCHRVYDSLAATPTVLGMPIRRLPAGPSAHSGSDSTPCLDCHGDSGHAPAGHGGSSDCSSSGCHDSGSHVAHLSATDPRGPGALECTDCHADGDYPSFAGGVDADSSGHVELDETTSCDVCHSPGGDYDGVDSTATASGRESVGAKDNWVAGVYATGDSTRPGKGLWCAGCHDGDEGTPDDAPSLVDGVYAPPVIGDEEAGYIYGTGWGFYETGHGVPSSATIPSNGFDAGPGLGCDDCHDYSRRHIDGVRRTFTATDTPDGYRTGYRLNLVDGGDPMLVPLPYNTPNSADNYRLCTQSGCHDPYPFLNETVEASSTPSLRRTNFWNENRDGAHNMHLLHVGMNQINRWAPDWGSTRTSMITCISCHNVHGSQYMGMIHDGSLISDTVTRTPGLRIWYLDDELSEWVGNNQVPPTPDDVTLAMSEGWIWSGGSSGNLCSHCHGNWNTQPVLRTVWQDYGIAPVLSWVGSTGYADDGAHPDTTSADEATVFKISYADGNNDAPVYVTLLIDLNDDGDFADPGETKALSEEAPQDQTFYNGNLYSTVETLPKAGDNQLDYRFETSDGVTGVSTTPTRTITVVNAMPDLPWTGESGFTSDGVAPNGGTTAVTNYEFRITYRDGDGEGPSGGAPSLLIDTNDDGDYEDAGESITMTDMGDPSVVTGKRFNHTTTLTRPSDDTLNYRFEATDGFDSVQSNTSTVTVLEDINLAPSLAWTGEAEYTDDGVDPENQTATKPFFLRVEYADANNDAPGVKQVWIDLDDDTVYGSAEKFDMTQTVTAADPDMTDGDYTNGEILAQTINIPYAGDGTLKYRFYFEDDNGVQASGVQGTDRTLSVYTALYVPSVYPTIQAAVDAANTSDTVLVDDGTYLGFAYNGKDITVESVNGPGSTFIQTASGTGWVVSFNDFGGSGSDSTIRGFTIRNSQGGIYSNKSDAVIDDCIIENTTFNGAILHESAAADPLVVRDSIIRNNSRFTVRISNSAAVVDILDTEFTDNTSPFAGAAITGSGTWNIERCSFDNNSSGQWGGALYCGGIINLHVSDSTFTNNTSVWNGGAINFVGNDTQTAVWIDRCAFASNSTSSTGGALQIRLGDYAVTNSTIVGNYATTSGGGIYTTSNSRPTFTNCTIAGNSGDLGGGIYSFTLAGNEPTIRNSILWGNDSRSSLTNQIDGNVLTRVVVQYTDIDQGFTGFASQVGNMRTNPSFVSPGLSSDAPTATGNYHLQVASPCEGQASAAYAPAVDIDGDARPDGTGDDMGSDEITGFEAPLVALPPLVTLETLTPPEQAEEPAVASLALSDRVPDEVYVPREQGSLPQREVDAGTLAPATMGPVPPLGRPLALGALAAGMALGAVGGALGMVEKMLRSLIAVVSGWF